VQPSPRRSWRGDETAGENGLQIGRRKRDAGQRTEKSFGGLTPHHAIVARQQQDGDVASNRQDEARWTERRNGRQVH